MFYDLSSTHPRRAASQHSSIWGFLVLRWSYPKHRRKFNIPGPTASYRPLFPPDSTETTPVIFFFFLNQTPTRGWQVTCGLWAHLNRDPTCRVHNDISETRHCFSSFQLKPLSQPCGVCCRNECELLRCAKRNVWIFYATQYTTQWLWNVKPSTLAIRLWRNLNPSSALTFWVLLSDIFLRSWLLPVSTEKGNRALGSRKLQVSSGPACLLSRLRP